jgi:hypothetical protein
MPRKPKSYTYSVRYARDGTHILDDLTLEQALLLATQRATQESTGTFWSAINIYRNDEYYLTINTKGA